MLLKCVNTDAGRGRAWIRSSLNEHSLERYMHLLISDVNALSRFYEAWAFLRDEERTSMLPTMASGLSSILFAITIDNAALNESPNIHEKAKSEVDEIIAHRKLVPPDNEKIVAKVETPANIVLNTDVSNNKADAKTNSLAAKKKKRKKPSQIVLFDKDELRTTKPTPKSYTSSAGLDQADGCKSVQEDKEQDNLDNQISLGEEAGDILDLMIQSPPDSSSFQEEDLNLDTSPQIPTHLLNYESVHLENNSDSENVMKESSLQEKMKKGIDAVRRRSRQSSIVSTLNPVDTSFDEDVSDIYSKKSTNHNKKEGSDSNSNLSFDSANTETASCDGREGSFANESDSTMPPKLTPMKNSNVGALIPIVSGTSSNTDKRGQVEAEDEIMSDDSISIKSFEEDTDYATACNSVAGSNIVSPIPHLHREDYLYSTDVNESSAMRSLGSLELNASLKLNQSNSSAGPSGFFSACTSTTASSIGNKGGSANSRNSSQIATISREDLKQALLSVMSRKDELQEQCLSLKKLLDIEINKSASLKEEIELNKRKADEIKDKQEARITSLARENELLKHQLKKYVSAVMKLRDGPQAYETLAKLEGNKNSESNGDNKYVDYHFEASEFEKKLIQVAEMHGELLEFNEHLQKTLQAKDAIIRRLREELIDVRGPLPGKTRDMILTIYMTKMTYIFLMLLNFSSLLRSITIMLYIFQTTKMKGLWLAMC